MAGAHQMMMGSGGQGGGDTALTVLTNASLTTNLKLCLDAGDASSYTSGTKWLDVSGGGYDFNLGPTGSPVFTGTAGFRGSYWDFTSDEFTYDTTNETWMQNIHKDNAIYTIIAFVYPRSTSGDGLAGTSARTLTDTGFAFNLNAGLTPRLRILDGSGAAALDVQGTTPLTAGKWNMVGLSVNEAGGAVSFFFVSGTADTAFDAAYATPSAGSATYTMQVAANGNDDQPMSPNTRMGIFLMWEGTALTSANMTTIWTNLRQRYGI